MMKFHCSLIVIFLMLLQYGIAQQRQDVADSLRLIYRTDTLTGVGKMGFPDKLAYNEIKDLALALAFTEELITLAEIYWDDGQFYKAHALAMEGLGHAKRLGKKKLISRASWVLAELDSHSGNYKEAYEHQSLYVRYKDSMDVETEDMSRYELQKAEKELQINLLKQKRQRTALWAIGATTLLLIVIAFGAYRRYLYIKRTNRTISEERDRSEKLLLNILPRETALELKKYGKVKAKRFDSVTVLFTDFKGFTRHAESVDPEKLVESIDYYFGQFDAIVNKHGLEKIKTVGDAYMCACGLPFPMEGHAGRALDAALEIMEFVEACKSDLSEDHICFDVRIGINTGPVVAGVVGTTKFAYDIWGDTVNIASRMESASEAGRINIAEETYRIIKDDFECDYRGKIDVKNRGRLKMYYVLGKKKKAGTIKKHRQPFREKIPSGSPVP